MDGPLAAFLDSLHREGREYDSGESDRRDRRRNLQPESAALLAVLVRAIAPQRILELGTSNGYSTIWLADAARVVGAELTSVDIDADRLKQAQANLEDAGLATGVELRHADGGSVLRGSRAGEYELIFLDAERSAYPDYWPELTRVLAPGGLLIVDNVLSHADEVAAFRALVNADTHVLEALAPSGDGLLFVVKER
jgi:predicted O-methyltransferase YrrM